METRDYYSILCIDRRASGNEIKQAYRRAAHRYHPDVSGSPDSESQFKAAAEAYRTLGHPDSRATYDRRAVPRERSEPVQGFSSPFEAWQALFQPYRWDWYWRV